MPDTILVSSLSNPRPEARVAREAIVLQSVGGTVLTHLPHGTFGRLDAHRAQLPEQDWMSRRVYALACVGRGSMRHRAAGLLFYTALAWSALPGCERGTTGAPAPDVPPPFTLPPVTAEKPVALAQRTALSAISPDSARIALPSTTQGPDLGTVRYGLEAVEWSLEGGKPMALPHRLPVQVAPDGQSLLQAGDRASPEHPTRLDLFFLDATGKQTGMVVDRYGPLAQVQVADEGTVAVAGPLLEGERLMEVALYDRRGEGIFRASLPDGRRTDGAVPTTEAGSTAVRTTHFSNHLEDHRLVLLDAAGQAVGEPLDLGILQKVVAVGGGSAFFVQARDRHALVNAADGALRWVHDQPLHLVSPFGAATDPTGKTLFLATAVWDGVPKEKYTWRLLLFDVDSGASLGELDLPGSYPGNAGRVVLHIQPDRVVLLAGDERITLAWRRP